MPSSIVWKTFDAISGRCSAVILSRSGVFGLPLRIARGSGKLGRITLAKKASKSGTETRGALGYSIFHSFCHARGGLHVVPLIRTAPYCGIGGVLSVFVLACKGKVRLRHQRITSTGHVKKIVIAFGKKTSYCIYPPVVAKITASHHQR
jgi:hypothetical protein